MNDPCHDRLILLSGLGADHRLFNLQRPAFPRLETPKWLKPRPTESLADYAERMALTIDTTEPFYLGGASFGGMVALEMARHVPAKAVFLIGSCRSGRSVPVYLRWIELFVRPLPPSAIDAGRFVAPFLVDRLQDFDAPQRDLVLDMFAGVQSEFVRWGGRAILEWSFEASLDMPVHHIHGDDDGLVPLRNVSPDRVVKGAGHMLSLTHADEVNSFLGEHMK